MRYYIVCFLCLLVPVIVSAQLGIGLKAGLNFANVTNTAGFKNSSRTGYMSAGIFLPKQKKYWASGQNLFFPARVMIIKPIPIRVM